MHEAAAGDKVIIRGKTVESPERRGVIVEVRGNEGEGPYVIRFDDGRESVIYPGPDFIVEPTV